MHGKTEDRTEVSKALEATVTKPKPAYAGYYSCRGIYAVIFLIALVAFLPGASAQISPGPLSRPHQSLN